MTLRLDDADTEALRRKAQDEGRSMQDVAQHAVNAYTHDQPAQFSVLVATIIAEDAELLERLAR